MGIGPGSGIPIPLRPMGTSGKKEKLIETEREMLHRIALDSTEPSIKDALENLHILVKLYHADDVADEHDENRRISQSMENRLQRLLYQDYKSKNKEKNSLLNIFRRDKK